MVWKYLVSGKEKRRPIIDIRGLNKLLILDVNAIPLQKDIISILRDCGWISILNVSSFFYQWRLYPSSWKFFTVVTYRGQETFRVPVIGCVNSIIDKILREVRDFARAYVDNMVVGSKSLDEHLDHLRRVFELFKKYNIAISPEKAFLGYPNIKLLSRRVNSIGLLTTKEILAAIAKIEYPTILGLLEYYFGLSKYLREYIYYYTQLAKPL